MRSTKLGKCHADAGGGIADKSRATGLFLRLTQGARLGFAYPGLIGRYFRLPLIYGAIEYGDVRTSGTESRSASRMRFDRL